LILIQTHDTTENGLGSGVIIDDAGDILTSLHVVANATDIQVTFADGSKSQARVTTTQPENDIAVLSPNRPPAQIVPAVLGNPNEMQVGDDAYVVGNPFGLYGSMSAGVISGFDRSFQPATSKQVLKGLIQIDAAVNPGNSGGPLLNLDGKVVGINAAILGASGGNIGIGFAIPMNLAKNVYEQLIATGQIDRGFLGVRPDDVTNDVAKSMGLEDTKGALITEVTEGSPADKAGLKTYDVVTAVNGQPVESAQDFRNKIAKAKPGSEAKMTVIREGERKTVTATLERRDADKLAGDTKTTDKDTLLGLEVATLTKADAQRLGFDGDTPTGVVITGVEPGSEAARKGIEPGLVILEVNRQPIKNVKEFNAAVQRAKDKGVVMLRVTDGNTRPIVTLSIKDK
jgi:serine protease Do